ncbi:MAG: quinone oxidoreductase [Hyphomonadaceae bacterium]|nr:quinone oxidoreductase [Hyphomonadaceae bacterium]
MKAIRIDHTGGPETLRVVDIAEPAPSAGEIRIRHNAIGVNFIDTYHRTGLYPVPLPSGLGLEGAGIVEAVGEGVTRFKIGDRVAYCSGPIGAYAEAHCVAAERAVKLPDGLGDDIAAASLLKGMTARYLLRKTFRVEPGHVIVIHAAAGGVGQIAVQWAKHLGAVVIAAVGSDDKAALARRLGADHAIVSTRENISERVRAITNGEGADVVYDSVGKDTYESSLDSLKPTGLLVSYGNASGPAPDVKPQVLSAKGSLFFTRPTLFHYVRTTALLDETAQDLFDIIGAGIVSIAAPTVYALADAAQAHRDLEGRRTTGSLVLKP